MLFSIVNVPMIVVLQRKSVELYATRLVVPVTCTLPPTVLRSKIPNDAGWLAVTFPVTVAVSRMRFPFGCTVIFLASPVNTHVAPPGTV
jgi:hypothetical protein